MSTVNETRDLAIGRWRCSCGRMELRDVRHSGDGPARVTFVPACTVCGESAEVLPVEVLP